MVVVLPWHYPIRVAEQVAVLDNLSDGRFIRGLGRGLGRVEFDGFRVPMDESPGRFVEGRARAMAERYIGGYWQTVLRHYEFAGDHLKRTKGYEYYGGFSDRLSQAGGADAATQFFMDLQIWGTPRQCYEKVLAVRERVG